MNNKISPLKDQLLSSTLLNRPHFSGIGGSGMGPLAVFCKLAGKEVSGSDRSFDQNTRLELKKKYEELGCLITPQKGQALPPSLSAYVYSTAVEETQSEWVEAKNRGIPLLHRSDVLALLSSQQPSIAIAGTSGKSTTTALTYHILNSCGLNPALITGASLLNLEEKTGWGQVAMGSGPLVFEADESDGTLIKYHPNSLIITNISIDHAEIPTLLEWFSTAIRQTTGPVILNFEDEYTSELLKKYKLPCPPAFFSKSKIQLSQGKTLEVKYTSFGDGQILSIGHGEGFLPIPGLYNLENALASITLGLEMGLDLKLMLASLTSFKGVSRRWETIGKNEKYWIIDDFAHNPDKIRSCIENALSILSTDSTRKRLLIHFQPHGYGPLRFILEPLAEVLNKTLSPQCILYLSPVYDAGGTANRDISSHDLALKLKEAPFLVICPSSREELSRLLIKELRPGDIFLSMGARDPELNTWTKKIWENLPSA